MWCIARNLVPFAQFKKREKHPWNSITFSKFAGCIKARNASHNQKGSKKFRTLENILPISSRNTILTH